jgi:hypothetical protein
MMNQVEKRCIKSPNIQNSSAVAGMFVTLREILCASGQEKEHKFTMKSSICPILPIYFSAFMRGFLRCLQLLFQPFSIADRLGSAIDSAAFFPSFFFYPVTLRQSSVVVTSRGLCLQFSMPAKPHFSWKASPVFGKFSVSRPISRWREAKSRIHQQESPKEKKKRKR